jgi:hypothetical protein
MISTRSLAVDPATPPNEPEGIAIPSEPPSADSSHAAVADVAYGLFLERGGVHGHDVEDWLRAEQILRERRSNAHDLGLADQEL